MWDHDDGEIPEALKDDLGVEIVEYVLEEDEQYLSSPQILRSLETEATPKKVGCRVRLIGRKLGMEDEEVDQFYSSNTTWDLDVLAENGLDELYEEIQAARR